MKIYYYIYYYFYKVAGEREVKAQIKMAFKGVNGKNIVCIRSLQLTQKPNNKQEVKTLEGALKSLNEAGEVERNTAAVLYTLTPFFAESQFELSMR
jgi:hypothetical protein